MPDRKSLFDIVPGTEMKDHPLEMWEREGDVMTSWEEKIGTMFQELTQPITSEKEELLKKKDICKLTK